MAFKIALTPTYKVKVNVEMPNDKGGVDKSDFLAQFARTDMDEFDELKRLPQREVLKRKLVGWSGLLDENNQEIPYGPEALDALIRITHAFDATMTVFWSSIFKAPQGN